MADKVQFELVAPERLLLSRAVDMVVVPGTEGDFGVLPGHAPLVSTLRPEVLEVYEDNRVSERIFVAGGFAEVTPERCTVLAEGAARVEDLDAAALEKEVRDLEEDLAEAEAEAERGPAAAALEIARAKLQVASRRSPR